MDLEEIPPGAWVEKVVARSHTYYYLRWRDENGRKRSIKLDEETAKKVEEKLSAIRRMRRERRGGLGTTPCSAQIPDYEEFSKAVLKLAEEGNEDAIKLAKRLKRSKGEIVRTLRILKLLLSES